MPRSEGLPVVHGQPLGNFPSDRCFTSPQLYPSKQMVNEEEWPRSGPDPGSRPHETETPAGNQGYHLWAVKHLHWWLVGS